MYFSRMFFQFFPLVKIQLTIRACIYISIMLRFKMILKLVYRLVSQVTFLAIKLLLLLVFFLLVIFSFWVLNILFLFSRFTLKTVYGWQFCVCSFLYPYSFLWNIFIYGLRRRVSDWRNIQDIIRVTFKSLTDVVRQQGDSIRELERNISSKASKNELNTALTLKANTSEVSRLHGEFFQKFEDRPCLQDLSNILREYVSKNDIQYMISSKVSLDEVQSLLKNKANSAEIGSEYRQLNKKLEDFQSEFITKMSNSADSSQFQEILHKLDQKANLVEMNLALEAKANKASVQQALHRKANKNDQNQDMQKDLQEMLSLLREKADISTVDNLGMILDNKADKSELSQFYSEFQEKADKIDIQGLENQINQKKIEIEENLTEKVEFIQQDIQKMYDNVCEQLSFRDELYEQINELRQNLDQKLSINEVDQFNDILRGEINENLENIKDSIKETLFRDQKTNQKENVIVLELMQEELKKFNVSLQKVKGEQLSGIHSKIKNLQLKQQEILNDNSNNNNQKNKNNLEKQNSQQSFQINNFEETIQNLKKSIEELANKKTDKKDFQEFKKQQNQINKNIEQKSSVQEVQEAIDICQADIFNRIQEIKQNQKAFSTKIDNKIKNKVGIEEINAILTQKADMSQVLSLIDQKISLNHQQLQLNQSHQQYQQVQQNQNQSMGLLSNPIVLEKELDDIKQDLNSFKIKNMELENQNHEINQNFEILQRDFQMKSDIKDVIALIDGRASLEDINKAFGEVQQIIQFKANQEDLNNVVTNQAIINETLCTENIVARWSWKSGQTIKGGLIPWENQLINTLPDNFLWDKQSSHIVTTTAPGIYQVSIGLFNSQKPNIQLCVNGLPAINQINKQNENESERNNQFQYGNITGTTIIEFLILPAKAQLTMIYEGDEDSDGFFGLKRL